MICSSSYRKWYLSYARAAKESKMRKVCNAYMDKAQFLYPSSAKVKICNSLYSTVFLNCNVNSLDLASDGAFLDRSLYMS